ncbi:hypothetical protein SAMN04515618_12511 [Collimonas sp. OK307]|nr:hypothetical protein SAMN04515618_12511 [Collimonas sp. OK307]
MYRTITKCTSQFYWQPYKIAVFYTDFEHIFVIKKLPIFFFMVQLIPLSTLHSMLYIILVTNNLPLFSDQIYK